MAARSKKKQTRRRTTGASRRPRPPMLATWLNSLGPLRIGLVALAILVMAMAPRPGAPAVLEGTQMLSTLVAPALAPIVFMVLMLDALMGRVMMGSASGAERMRYRRIVMTNLAAGILLFLWWTPYFARLFRA